MTASSSRMGRPPDVSDEEARRYFRERFGDRLPELLQQVSARDLVPIVVPYAKKASDYLDLGNDRMFSAARAKRLLEEDGVSLPPPKETSKIIHVHPQPPDLVENVRYQQLLGWLVHDATAAFDKIGSPLPKFTTPAMSPAEQVKHESGAVLDRLLVWVTQRRAIVLAVALFGMVLASLAPLVTTRSAPSSVVETFIAGTTREPIGSPLIEPYNRWPKPERLTGWKGNVEVALI